MTVFNYSTQLLFWVLFMMVIDYSISISLQINITLNIYIYQWKDSEESTFVI